MADLIGVTNSAVYGGIPDATVLWGTPGNQTLASATSVSASVFTSFRKTPGNERSITKDNSNEVLAIRRTNKTWTISFSAKIKASTVASALTPLQQSIPLKDDILNISTADTQISGACYVESADLGYTPDGDAVIDFTATKYPVTLVAMS